MAEVQADDIPWLRVLSVRWRDKRTSPLAKADPPVGIQGTLKGDLFWFVRVGPYPMTGYHTVFVL